MQPGRLPVRSPPQIIKWLAIALGPQVKIEAQPSAQTRRLSHLLIAGRVEEDRVIDVAALMICAAMSGALCP